MGCILSGGSLVDLGTEGERPSRPEGIKWLYLLHTIQASIIKYVHSLSTFFVFGFFMFHFCTCFVVLVQWVRCVEFFASDPGFQKKKKRGNARLSSSHVYFYFNCSFRPCKR